MQYTKRSDALAGNVQRSVQVGMLLLVLGYLVLAGVSCGPDGYVSTPRSPMEKSSTYMCLNPELARDIIRDFLKNEKAETVEEFCTRHNVTERTLEGGIRGPNYWLGSWCVRYKSATNENESKKGEVLKATLPLMGGRERGPFMVSDGLLVLELEPVEGQYDLIKSSVVWQEHSEKTGDDSKDSDAYHKSQNAPVAEARARPATVDLELLEAAIRSFLHSEKPARVAEASSKYAIEEDSLDGGRSITWHVGQWLVIYRFPREAEYPENSLRLASSGYMRDQDAQVSENALELIAMWGYVRDHIDWKLTLTINCDEDVYNLRQVYAGGGIL